MLEIALNPGESKILHGESMVDANVWVARQTTLNPQQRYSVIDLNGEPVVTRLQDKKVRRSVYGFEHLRPGESVVIPGGDYERVRAYNYAKRNGLRFSCRYVDGGIEVTCGEPYDFTPLLQPGCSSLMFPDADNSIRVSARRFAKKHNIVLKCYAVIHGTGYEVKRRSDAEVVPGKISYGFEHIEPGESVIILGGAYERAKVYEYGKMKGVHYRCVVAGGKSLKVTRLVDGVSRGKQYGFENLAPGESVLIPGATRSSSACVMAYRYAEAHGLTYSCAVEPGGLRVTHNNGPAKFKELLSLQIGDKIEIDHWDSNHKLIAQARACMSVHPVYFRIVRNMDHRIRQFTSMTIERKNPFEWCADRHIHRLARVLKLGTLVEVTNFKGLRHDFTKGVLDYFTVQMVIDGKLPNGNTILKVVKERWT